MSGGFEGRSAVVTGAAAGFGLAVATKRAAQVANSAVWLLSDEAGYVSGAIPLIDGALKA